jgi:hypothetical protein
MFLTTTNTTLDNFPFSLTCHQWTVSDFQQRINLDPISLADRLWVKNHLDSDEEKLRFSS